MSFCLRQVPRAAICLIPPQQRTFASLEQFIAVAIDGVLTAVGPYTNAARRYGTAFTPILFSQNRMLNKIQYDRRLSNTGQQLYIYNTVCDPCTVE